MREELPNQGLDLPATFAAWPAVPATCFRMSAVQAYVAGDRRFALPC